MRQHLKEPQEPKVGLYRSDDPNVVAEHIAQSVRGGISFMVTLQPDQTGVWKLTAVLVRSIRRGPLIEPIMVHPAYQRRDLATALLAAALDALNAGRAETVYSQCQLGNAASLAWHENNCFEEIPNYFAATHRWHHFAWLADRYEHLRQPDQASAMRQLAQHWETIVQELEASNERWSFGLLD